MMRTSQIHWNMEVACDHSLEKGIFHGDWMVFKDQHYQRLALHGDPDNPLSPLEHSDGL